MKTNCRFTKRYREKTYVSFAIPFLFFLLLLGNVSCRSGKEMYASSSNGEIHIPEDHSDKIPDYIMVQKDILYGEAKGFYVSKPMEKISGNKFSSLVKEVVDIFGRTSKKRVDLPLYMDIYCPNGNTDMVRPVMLFVHGGGFFFGDKENKLQMELTENLVENGFIVASINYRLGSNLWGFNDIKKAIYCCIQDTRSALRYLTYYAEELKIDPEQIYLSGSSSGAIVALTTAFMDEDEIFDACNKRFLNKLGGLDNSGNKLNCDFKVAGVVALWGCVIDLNIIDERNQIPVLLFHGTEDDILYNDSGIPFGEYLGSYMKKVFFNSQELYGSYAIYKHMRKHNIPVRYVQFDGYKHAPHEEKDGSFNENINIVKQEIKEFLFQHNHEYWAESRRTSTAMNK